MTADRCICDGAAYHTAEENRARHPFIVNPGCRVHAQVTADRTPERQPTLPFSLRMPTNRVDNLDGRSLNIGTNHVDVQVVLDPDMELRGECRSGYAGPVIALREWDEQVFLHELLHAAVAYAQPLVATTHPPHGHEVIARVEVALWETGWRFRDDSLAALRAECDVLREQTARVEAVLAEPDDVQQWEDDTHECPDFLEVPIVTVARVHAALHPQDPDHERTSG